MKQSEKHTSEKKQKNMKKVTVFQLLTITMCLWAEREITVKKESKVTTRHI